jgi:hypothetical protein
MTMVAAAAAAAEIVAQIHQVHVQAVHPVV